MADAPRIRSIRPVVVHVTTRTNWVFVVVETDDGLTGIGEATLDGTVPQVLAEVEAAAGRLTGSPAHPSTPAPPGWVTA